MRPALEVGAAEKQYITSMELILDEKISVNLKITNPRTMEEEDLTTPNINKFMMYELIDLTIQKYINVTHIPAL